MPLFLLPFFQWCDTTAVSRWMRQGTWEFPLVETVHILALALLFATVVVINLRLMGLLMRGWTVAALARELTPYLNGSLVLILITGTLLFLSEALKTFGNEAFSIKVYCLISVLLFHFIVVRNVTKADEVSRLKGWTVGLTSLL